MKLLPPSGPGRTYAVALSVAVATLAAGIPLMRNGPEIVDLLVFIAWVFAIVSPVERLSRFKSPMSAGSMFLRVFVLGVAMVVALGFFAVLLLTTRGHGRPLRRWVRPRIGPMQSGGRWLLARGRRRAPDNALRAAVLDPNGGDVRARAAAGWRSNGRMEHASVAAFADLSGRLMALGAPPHLLREVHQDALDEIRHAELCFSLARDLDGQDLEAGCCAARGSVGWSPRPLAFASLAALTLIDGVVNEGASARILADLAKRAERSEIRVILLELARDEARHAAHAWHTVRWCFEQGGCLVEATLQAALRALPASGDGDGAGLRAAPTALEALGIAEPATEARAHALVGARTRARLERLLQRHGDAHRWQSRPRRRTKLDPRAQDPAPTTNRRSRTGTESVPTRNPRSPSARVMVEGEQPTPKRRRTWSR